MPNSHAFLAEYGDVPVCGRCLVVINATVPIRAKHPRGEYEAFQYPTEMTTLKAWVIGKILDRGWWFEIGTVTDCFIPISTWHGDPVCAYHLYALAELERRSLR